MRQNTYDLILRLASEEHIKFLTPITLDMNTKKDRVKYKCLDCGAEYEVSLNNLLDTRRKAKLCLNCNAREEFICRLTTLYGRNPYYFLSPFKGYTQPLTVKCKDCGETWEAKSANILLMNSKLKDNNHPCKGCSKKRLGQSKDIKDLENYLINKFGSCDYDFPEPEKYMGMSSKQNFKIVCKFCGHEMNTLITNIIRPRNGRHYCRVCNKKDRAYEGLEYPEKCEIISGGSIEPLEPYIDNRTKIKHRCNICGYEWLKLPLKPNSDHNGCPRCANIKGYSNGEKEVVKYLKSLGLTNIAENHPCLPNKQEIDIYLPDYHLGIEFDGLYWHSEDKKGKTYHLDKTLEADKLGIRLIHIFEDEWLYKKDIVQAKLRNILKLNNQKNIYARKCKAIDISSSVKNDFLNKNHIQGGDRCTISKALEYNGEIVSVITFAKLRRSLGQRTQKDGVYELSRFASKYHVTGGFSKLMAKVLEEHPEIKEIITYADLRWSASSKNVYEVNGFKLDHIAKPNYWYFDAKKSKSPRYHRFNFRKQELQAKFPDIYQDGLTEFEIMDKTQYKRIWDCGNLVYKFIRK